jgi:DNA polymerase-3 subunit epsilon
MATDHRVLVFDVETTGTDKRLDQVIELCVQFGVDHDAEHQIWRIRPDVPIHPGAQAVHGISMDDLAGSPRFGEVADAIRAIFVGAEVLVGYNLAFDIDMLQAEFQRIGQPPLDLADKQIVDPFRLWQQCEPRSLQDAHRRFVGQEFAAAHSAAADVAATGRVLVGMLGHFGLEGDWTAIARVCEPERQSWIGPSRHLRWDPDGHAVLSFGKHAGTPLARLARGPDAGYLQWVIDKDFPIHVREVCKRATELAEADFVAWLGSAYGRPAPAPAGDHVAVDVVAVDVVAVDVVAVDVVGAADGAVAEGALAEGSAPVVEGGESVVAVVADEPAPATAIPGGEIRTAGRRKANASQGMLDLFAGLDLDAGRTRSAG